MKVDIFSAGIILYIMLTIKNNFFNDIIALLAMHLFVETNMKRFLKKINNAKFALILKKLIFIYRRKVFLFLIIKVCLAMDLLKAMLNPNPLLRITARDALKHPWFEKSKTYKDN